MILASVAMSLSACESTKEQFDFSKKAPDEFAVVKRAPLEMPPNYNLPPPTPGASRPQEQATDQLARNVVIGEDATREIAHENNVSEGEAILLQKTGGANANPAIRRAVDKETAEISEDETPGIDKLKKMVGQNVETPAKVVDPAAELNRLKQNQAQGKPLSTGKTPSLDN